MDSFGASPTLPPRLPGGLCEARLSARGQPLMRLGNRTFTPAASLARTQARAPQQIKKLPDVNNAEEPFIGGSPRLGVSRKEADPTRLRGQRRGFKSQPHLSYPWDPEP